MEWSEFQEEGEVEEVEEVGHDQVAFQVVEAGEVVGVVEVKKPKSWKKEQQHLAQ